MNSEQKMALIQRIVEDFMEHGEDQSAKTVLYVIDTIIDFNGRKTKK